MNMCRILLQGIVLWLGLDKVTSKPRPHGTLSVCYGTRRTILRNYREVKKSRAQTRAYAANFAETVIGL